MACEYCGQTGSHHYRCPNYDPPKAYYYCSICGSGIYDGEEYIRNDDGDVIHFDCINGLRGLLEWLGYDVKTWDDLNENGGK